MSGTFEPLKRRAIAMQSSGTPTAETSQILDALQNWTAAIVSIRQQN
jgi:hypothetical protein